MPVVYKGAPVIASIKENMQYDMAVLGEQGIVPSLSVVRMGNRPADIAYENSALKKCEDMHIKTQPIRLPDDADPKTVLAHIDALNRDPDIHGVLVLRPLPPGMESMVKSALLPAKDVDCMCDENLLQTLSGEEGGFAPCTAQAVIRLLDHYRVEVEGKNVVVIGRSLVVGKPLAMMLLKRNATVTVCHTRTQQTAEIARRAHMVIAAAGSLGMVDKSYIRPGALVIDVGVNMDANGKMAGDVDFPSVSEVAGGITPVPGGIGGITSWLLLEHVVQAAKKAAGMEG